MSNDDPPRPAPSSSPPAHQQRPRHRCALRRAPPGGRPLRLPPAGKLELTELLVCGVSTGLARSGQEQAAVAALVLAEAGVLVDNIGDEMLVFERLLTVTAIGRPG